ncbi:hypothetical protein K438DRAFT_1972615 [Mycena galopus ATCC 62051]|nr:hypothetical protein K438DRAFT_1972615 [Mycena galopus ATCC 62051]
MDAYDDRIGSILIGTWLASILYGIVLSQMFEYIRLYPKDAPDRKGIVLICVFFTLVAVTAEYADVYLLAVTYWGNIEALQQQYWCVAVFASINSVVAAIVQAYLVRQFYLISKNMRLSLILAVFVIVGFAGSLMVSILLEVHSEYSARNKAKVAAQIWLIATASADISIAMALIWKLHTMKSSYNGTQSLIKRLIIGAVRTGSATSIVAVMTLLLYIVNEESNVPTAFHFLSGPLYMLTLLYNVNLRRHEAVISTGRSKENPSNHTCLDGIQVHRTSVVTTDRIPDPNPPRSIEICPTICELVVGRP